MSLKNCSGKPLWSTTRAGRQFNWPLGRFSTGKKLNTNSQADWGTPLHFSVSLGVLRSTTALNTTLFRNTIVRISFDLEAPLVRQEMLRTLKDLDKGSPRCHESGYCKLFFGQRSYSVMEKKTFLPLYSAAWRLQSTFVEGGYLSLAMTQGCAKRPSQHHFNL